MYATPVFLILKGINTGQKKCSQLVNTLKTNASNDFNNFTIKFDSDMKKSLKRNRSCLSLTKTGCTPKREKEESFCKYICTQYQQKTIAVYYTNSKKVTIKDTVIAWSKSEGELLQNVHVYSVYSKNTNQLYITLYDPYNSKGGRIFFLFLNT